MKEWTFPFLDGSHHSSTLELNLTLFSLFCFLFLFVGQANQVRISSLTKSK